METVRRSKVWLNFTKINDKSARCNICKTIISCKGGCTTNMIKHLRAHGVQITECPVFDALRRPSSVATSSAASTSGSDPHPSTALSGKQQIRKRLVNSNANTKDTKNVSFTGRSCFLIFMCSSFIYAQRTCVLHCRRHYLSRTLTPTAREGRYDHFPKQELFLILYCTCC